uniref:Stromal antigen-like protein n=1 Tax=Dugesia japonica TaxID=6161 RepID=C9EHT1_DUGJA|nr:stromal antigen-like protein [Dugesia japonica]
MKAGLAKAREINRLHTAKMVMECLISGLNELMVEQSGFVDRSTEGFQSLKGLARRLNLSFGLDLMKIREAMMELHKMAIDTVPNAMVVTGPSRPPANLLCLELAAEFSNKLIGSDKKFILDSINKTFPNPGENEGWMSLYTYRMSLDPDTMDNTSTHNEKLS